MTQAGDLNRQELETIKERIAAAALRADRQTGEITLIAVTKAHPVIAMLSAYENGLTTLGESRVQETAGKLPRFPYREDTELHLIGHLQKNKVRKALELYDVIESVDSLKLAERLNYLAGECGKNQRIYLEVNAGSDPAKYGFTIAEVLRLTDTIRGLSNLSVEGLMVVAPLIRDEKILRETFARTRTLRDNLNREGLTGIRNLSMGMSADFELAIEEGATHIRIGTALFGSRPA